MFAGLAGFGLIASGLALATLPAANAAIANSPGPIYPYGNSTQEIDETTGLVTIPAGTTYRVSVGVNIGEASDLLPVTQQTTFGLGAFNPTVPANLSVVSPADFYWSTSGTGFCPPPSENRSTTLTLPAASCHTTLSGYWGMAVKNSTSSAITWDLPIEGAKLSVNGSNVDRTTGVLNENYFMTASVSRNFPEGALANGVALIGNEGSIFFNFQPPCFDATDGSVLDVVYVATLDDVAISTTAGSGLNMSWTVGGATKPATFTYQANGVVGRVEARLNNVSASEAGKLLRVSIDFQKAGKSVSGECNWGPPPTTFTYPTVGALSTAAQAKATAMLGTVSEALSFPAGTISGDTSWSSADTGGGVFYWGRTGATVKIVNPGPTGAKPIASATAKMLTLTLPPGHRFYGFAWYGSARDKWAALSGGFAGYKIWTGNLANATGRAEKTLAYDAPDALCSLPSRTYVSLLSAPTTFPTLSVRCMPSGDTSGNQTVIAKTNIGAAAAVTLTKLATQGDITTENKCSFGSTGVNSKEAGADTAIIVYGSIAPTPAPYTGGGGMPPQCSATGITGRKITTISQAGVAATTTIAQSPWGATDPSTISWASGKAANTWIGVGKFGSDLYPLTVSASRVITKKASKISFTAATNFSASGMGITESVTPVAEVSATKWVLVRNQRNSSNFLSIKQVSANATLDPATGTVKSGQGLKIENLSMMGGAQAILTSNSRFTASKWYSNFYVMTAAGKFKVATWWVLGT